MKTTTFGRVVTGVALTTSAVVAFVQVHNGRIGGSLKTAAGWGYSKTETVASAKNTYLNLDDDLSSLLQNAKTDYSGAASKASDAAASATSPPPPDVAAAVEPAMRATQEAAMKATQDAAVKATQATQDAVNNLVTATQAKVVIPPPPPLEAGKARPLFSFVRASVSGDAASAASGTNWEVTKTKSILLRDNIVRLAGKDPAEIDFPKISLPTVAKGQAVAAGSAGIDFSGFNIKALQEYSATLSPNEQGLAALAATGMLLLVLGAANKGNDKPKTETMDIAASSDAIGGLTDELLALQSRMEALEANGIDLDSQLKDAKEKLTQKELVISKAKLKAADDSLNLNREINSLNQKIAANKGKVKDMDIELAKARQECRALMRELESARVEQEKAQKAEEAKKKLAEKKKKTEEAKKKAAEAKKKAADDRKKAAEEKKKAVAAKKEAEKAAKEAKLPEASAAAPKKAAPKKKAAAPKKKAAAPKKKTAPQKKTAAPKKKAAAPAKKAAAPKKATAPKKAAAKTKAPAAEAKEEAPAKKKAPAPSTGDLTTLTKSALSRTTVKDFNAFLTSKGISTVDKDGKQLKKAEMIKAVNALSN